MATRGSRPVRGFVEDFDLDNRPDLGIAHENGSFSAFVSRPEGFRLAAVFASRTGISVTDVAVIRRNDTFEILGVGNRSNRLVPLSQFRLPSAGVEFAAFVGRVVPEILSRAVASVVFGPTVALAIAPLVAGILDIPIGDLLLRVTVAAGWQADEGTGDDDSEYPFAPEIDWMDAIAGVGNRAVDELLAGPAGQPSPTSPAVEGNEEASDEAVASYEVLNVSRNHGASDPATGIKPGASFRHKPSQDSKSESRPEPSHEPARPASHLKANDEQEELGLERSKPALPLAAVACCGLSAIVFDRARRNANRHSIPRRDE